MMLFPFHLHLEVFFVFSIYTIIHLTIMLFSMKIAELFILTRASDHTDSKFDISVPSHAST